MTFAPGVFASCAPGLATVRYKAQQAGPAPIGTSVLLPPGRAVVKLAFVSESQKSSIESASAGSTQKSEVFCSIPMDRRHHKRFDLQATARFFWKDAAGSRFEGQGLTRDISETGVFVLTPHIPPSGTPVRLEVRAMSLSGSDLLMRSKGHVVRVVGSAPPADGLGFAAATGSLELRNCNPAVMSPEEQFKPVPGLGPVVWRGNTRKPN